MVPEMAIDWLKLGALVAPAKLMHRLEKTLQITRNHYLAESSFLVGSLERMSYSPDKYCEPNRQSESD